MDSELEICRRGSLSVENFCSVVTSRSYLYARDFHCLSLDPSVTRKSSTFHSGYPAGKTAKSFTDKLLCWHDHTDVPCNRASLRSELALSVLCIPIMDVALS